MGVICAWLTIWYTLRTFVPWSPSGWIVVEGHSYVDEPSFARDGHEILPIRCERCGHREEQWW